MNLFHLSLSWLNCTENIKLGVVIAYFVTEFQIDLNIPTKSITGVVETFLSGN